MRRKALKMSFCDQRNKGEINSAFMSLGLSLFTKTVFSKQTNVLKLFEHNKWLQFNVFVAFI